MSNNNGSKNLDRMQRTSLVLMGILVLLTFLGTNLQAILWQSSDWLVSTVLPSVVVELTNEEREELNQQPLRRNVTLDAAAKQKAKHMAANQYFAHYSPDGVSPWYWFKEAGYVYAHAGENLAIHFTDSSEVVEAWMDSPTHRANIVDSKYTEIGVGTARGTYEGFDTVYVVQLFGTPAEAPLPTIEKEPLVVAAASPLPEVQKDEPEIDFSTEDDKSSDVEVVAETPLAIEEIQEFENSVPEYTEPELTESTFAASADPSDEPVITFEEEQPDVVVIETDLIATSSGLAVASFTGGSSIQEPVSPAALATQPNMVLQWTYVLLGSVVVLLLLISLITEARRAHFVQVAYSVAMLFGMSGLWYLHNVLTEGALIL